MKMQTRGPQPRTRLVWIVGVLLLCGSVVVARTVVALAPVSRSVSSSRVEPSL